MMRSLPILFICISVLLVSSCTKSLPVNYQEGVEYSPGDMDPERYEIAVESFSDERVWIMPGDEKSKSFIAQQDQWKFGLTYEGREYAPVSDVIQDIFVKELQNAGFEAFPLAEGKSDYDFCLGGQIITFEFVNEKGVWTVDSRTHVALELTLKDDEGMFLFEDKLFNESERRHEGMAVLHSSNVYMLFNVTLKKVISEVLKEIEAKIGEVKVSLVINGHKVSTEYFSGVV